MKTRAPVIVLGVPLDLGAGRRGVDMGPSAIRVAGLHDKLDKLGLAHDDWGDVDVDNPGHRRDMDPKLKYLREIKHTCRHLSDRVEEIKLKQAIPIVLGGDHSLAMGTVAGLAKFYRAQKQKLGLLWIDAHTDINTPDTTPSGNIHGMPLSHISGMGAPELTELAGFSPMVNPAHTVVIGVRSVDHKERENVRKAGITVFTMRDIDEHGMHDIMEKALKIVCKDTVGFHFSFDLDGCDPLIAPGVGTPVQGGLSYRESHLICESVADSGKMLAMDIVELNSTMDVRNQTAQLAVGLIGSALGESIL